MTELERRLRPLLEPVASNGGEYLRPWMTDGSNPAECRVWLVGANPAKTFPVSAAGPFEDYLDALFNRSGKSIRGLYDKITEGRPSLTRRNIDKLSARLAESGGVNVLETNLNCYPTRMSTDLNAPSRREARERGKAIFDVLLETLQPDLIWLHGSRVLKDFRRLYEPRLPSRLTAEQRWSMHRFEGRSFILTPSLALPAFNRWARDFNDVLTEICQEVGR